MDCLHGKFFRQDFGLPLVSTDKSPRSILWLGSYTSDKTGLIEQVIGKEVRTENQTFDAHAEYDISKDLDHYNVCKVYDFCPDKKTIIMEYIPGSDLFDHVYKGLDQSNVLPYFSQMLDAVEYLHKAKKIAHRDLKLENFMVDLSNRIVLIDFGFSQICDDLISGTCGSYNYASPELANANISKYDPFKNDIWALGICLYAMVCNQLPFGDTDDSNSIILRKIITEPLEPKLQHIDDNDLCDLLRGMLDKNPDTRYSFDQIRKSSWFSGEPKRNIAQKMVDFILMY